MQDDRSEREKHLEELYEAMKAKVHALEEELARWRPTMDPQTGGVSSHTDFERVIQYRTEDLGES